MTEYYKQRDNCRLCESKNLKLCFKLEPTPPANAFIYKEKILEKQIRFPLDIFFCEDCFHMQLLDIVDPNILFENYVYVSGTSPIFVKHFEEYTDYILEKFPQKVNSLILDIGSNDGTLLRFFKKNNLKILGIDPAKEICKKANLEGIETLNNFFNYEFSKYIKQNYGEVGIITANNVFAHVDELKDFIQGVKNLLSEDGIFVFEVSYVVDVIQKLLFDIIYHEHLSYHSVISLVSFFKKNDMELIEAIHVDTHGGSLRGIAKLKNGKHKVGKSVEKCVKLEMELGLNKLETYKEFFERLNIRKNELQKLFKKLKADNKTICGFGAPAKATTFMYQFGIDENIIDFIIDDSPLKQGLFSPGMHIPIYSSKKLYSEKPDYVVILAWNFAESIMNKHVKYTEMGGHFIVPLPKLQVY